MLKVTYNEASSNYYLIVIIFAVVVGGFFAPQKLYAQTLDVNATAKAVESLKLKTGQLIDHETVKPISIVAGKLIEGRDEVAYSYISEEVQDASNVVFGDYNYSNTEKLDNNHYRIYSYQKYFKDENNFIHYINFATTTPEIWSEASVQTLSDKIISILKTPYANAGTSYSTADGYMSRYNNTNWYEVRTSSVADVIAYDRLIAYNWVQLGTENGDIYYNFRTPLTFDLSLIDPSNILSGSINLYSEEDDEVVQHAYAFFEGTQAFPPTINDYSNYVNNIYTDTIENSDVVTNGFTSWTLNSNGIDYLKTGQSDFMFMETMYDIGSTTPPDYLDVTNARSFNSSLSQDYESHPYIELEVSASGTSTVPVITCDNMSYNQKCVITSYHYVGSRLDNTTATTTYAFMDLIILFSEIIIGYYIITKIMRF